MTQNDLVGDWFCRSEVHDELNLSVEIWQEGCWHALEAEVSENSFEGQIVVQRVQKRQFQSLKIHSICSEQVTTRVKNQDSKELK